MAYRRDRARLRAGAVALATGAGLCLYVGLRSDAVVQRTDSFNQGVKWLARGIAGDLRALDRSAEAFHKAIGGVTDDPTPYIGAHVAETVGRVRVGTVSESETSPLLLAFVRGDYSLALRLSIHHRGPEARYGVRLARALLAQTVDESSDAGLQTGAP